MNAPALATIPHLVSRTRLAGANLEISRLGLGLANMHLLPDETARRGLLHRALDLGITHFDTARFYSDGLSETTVGKFLRENRGSITIATKFGLLPTPLIAASGAAAPVLRKVRSALHKLRLVPYPRRSYTRASMRKALTESLRALRTSHIDIYFVHEPLPDSQIEDGLFEELLVAKTKGDIRFIGVAGENISKVADRFGASLDVIQTAEAAWNESSRAPDITYSLFSRNSAGRLSREEVKSRLQTALARRPQGAVLVQTRSPDHLGELARLAGEA